MVIANRPGEVEQDEGDMGMKISSSKQALDTAKLYLVGRKIIGIKKAEGMNFVILLSNGQTIKFNELDIEDSEWAM